MQSSTLKLSVWRVLLRVVPHNNVMSSSLKFPAKYISMQKIGLLGGFLTEPIRQSVSIKCQRLRTTQAHLIMSVLYLLCATIFTGRNEVVAKVMFLLEFVILFTEGVWQGEPPPGTRPPSPPRHGDHPPREADSGIRSTSGRYASYWNAFLFVI